MKESRVFWPLVLFPYSINNAHTRSYTGRCWVKDIKASFSFANIILSDLNLTCRYRIFRGGPRKSDSAISGFPA
jgi:hypothetical protein